MNKTLPFILLCLLMAVMLVACGSSGVEATDIAPGSGAAESDSQATEVATDTPLPTATATPEPSPTPTSTPTSLPTATATPTPVGGGGLIAFSSIRLGSDYTDPAVDIVMLNPNDGSLTWLTGGAEADLNSNPSWSPDGAKLIYTKVKASSPNNAGGLLYKLDLKENLEVEVASPFGSGLYHPSWSGDDKILVSRYAGREYPQIWTSTTENPEWSLITPEISFQFAPVWSPDGNTYAFSGSPGVIYTDWFETIFGGFRLTDYVMKPRDVCLVDVETGVMRQVTSGEEDEFDPAWSPDGQKLAFVSMLDEDNAEIFVINKNGSGLTRLTDHAARDTHPNWSPDGSMITFASNRDGNYEIYIMDTDGQNPMRMTNSLMDDLEPVWSPAPVTQALMTAASGEPQFTGSLAGFEPTRRDMSEVAKILMEGGLLTRWEGAKHSYDDFAEEWAQINWYSYYRLGRSPTDFIIRANASWESASDKANWFSSGCGFVFREEDVDNHYLIYLDMDGFIHLSRDKNGYKTYLGKSNIKYPVNKPADSANIMLAVEGNEIMFFVNGYLMLHRQDTALNTGNLALTLLSGTNKDFGTRCEMSNIELWELRK